MNERSRQYGKFCWVTSTEGQQADLLFAGREERPEVWPGGYFGVTTKINVSLLREMFSSTRATGAKISSRNAWHSGGVIKLTQAWRPL
jgi:hypothetical protein